MSVSSSSSGKSSLDDPERGHIQPQIDEKQLTQWDDALDAANPHNWPAWKRHYHTFVPSAAAIVCTIASSIYTPAIEDVASSFSISNEVALLPFSLYVLGLGFAPLIAAPCSETFGRRAVYLISLPLFAIFTLGAGFSQNIATLCILRFFAGVAGGPSVVIGTATIADLYEPTHRGVPMTIYVATPFCGPAIAPLIGAYATQDRGWRWTFWANLIMVAAVILAMLPMQETYKIKILQKRAKKRGLRLPESNETIVQTIKKFARTSLFRPLHMAFTEPIVALVALYIAINFATLYSFFAAFPGVLQQAYGFGLGQIGITFLAIGVGAIVACCIIIAVDFLLFKKESARLGKVPTEMRLYYSMLASILLPSSLFWFAWTARSDIHWICPVLAEAVFSCGNLLAFMSFALYLSDTYGPRFTASAMTANTFARYLLGAAFPLFIVYLYDALGTGWATSILAFLSLLMTPIPWIFYFFGPRLRSKPSQYRP